MNKADCRIAVIGGGLSGLVITAGLEKKGYRNVTLFERDNRVGGKLQTIWYKDRSYELGAIFGLPVERHLKSLMEEFNIKIDGPNLSLGCYDVNGDQIMQIPKEVVGDLLQEIQRLPAVLKNYQSLEKPTISHHEESLTWPFSQWCELHRFRVLKNIYMHHFTSYGFGDIDTIPALYVLRRLNYETIMSLIDLPEYFTWNAGVNTLIEALTQKISNLRLGQKVTKITVSNRQLLYVQTDFERLEFDQVIITAPLDQFSHIYDQDSEMSDFLRSIKYQEYKVYAFIVNKLAKGCGLVLKNLSKKTRGHLIMLNSRWESSDEEDLLTVYAYDHPKYSRAAALKIIEDDLLKLGIENPRLYQFQSWRQSPHVDSQILQKGFYQKMEAMQGKDNIFLAGEIMSTVSMENCIRYSKYLIDQYF